MVLLSLASCNNVYRIAKHNIPGITDYLVFDLDIIDKPDTAFIFPQSDQALLLPSPSDWVTGKHVSKRQDFETFLRRTGTVSFLIIKNDSILYENYFHNYRQSTAAQVFSITKSLVSALVGIAIEEGYITDINQKVSDFIPAYKEDGRDAITVMHLLNMTDGLNFSDYTTMHLLLGMYYHNNQKAYVDKIKLKHNPGEVFEYKSVSTLILGMVLEQATGRPLAKYIEEKIWKPLGMEYTAAMMLDSPDGTPLAYGGLVARARDLAKIGRLYINKGNWEGTQIIPEKWVENSFLRDTVFGQYYNYNKSWWLDTYIDRPLFEKRDLFAGGYAGQVLYINPEHDLIIVRQGNKRSGIKWGNSISKLAFLIVNEKNDEEPFFIDKNFLAGNYKNHSGINFEIKIVNNRLLITDGFVTIPLEKESMLNYRNRKENIQLFIDYIEGEVNGLFLDRNRSIEYFSKDVEFIVEVD